MDSVNGWIVRGAVAFAALIACACAVAQDTAQGPALDTPESLRAEVGIRLESGATPEALGAATRLVGLTRGEHAGDLLLLARTSYFEALRRIAEGEAGGGITDALWFDAEDAARRASTIAGSEVEGGTFLGFVFVQRGKYADAISALDTVLSHAADDAEALSLRGYAHMGAGSTDAAVADLDRAIALMPKRFDIKVHRAKAIAMRSLVDGATELERLADTNLVDDAFATDVAEILAPRPDLATRVLARVFAKHESSAAAVALARARIQAGDFKLARDVLDGAIERDPADGSLRAWRAEASRKAAAFDARYVDDVCFAATADCSEANWAQNLLSASIATFVDQNDWESARRMCQTLVALDERSRVSLANLALTQRNLGQVAESEALYREVLDRAPDDGSVWNDYGLLLAGTGRSADAIAAFERAAALGNIDALENDAMLQLRLGHADAARKNLLEVLRREPARVRSAVAFVSLVAASRRG